MSDNSAPSTSKKLKSTNSVGRPKKPIWRFFEQGDEVDKGHYAATCSACVQTFRPGKTAIMEKHIINFKALVHEIQLQREVDFHDNVIRFYGVTTSTKENQRKEYSLVIEYAENGTLRKYLKENFESLTWDNKFNLAFQLVYAVSCLHDEGIVHRDLHSNNVLYKNLYRLLEY
ncbi:unnamed protein product [Rhizophagus irregularis]|uniref:Protein kinase domain-containing protein n=1 Tax=Rhizophagus irregularis TaxID=588596 RepID=A0A915ZNE8_9GLOM|nr:unnamed protein product [Rhizophagus irregularis]